LLSSVLQHFFDRSREKRQARPIASHEVEEALGEERMQWLIKQTGLTRGEIIGGLSFPTEEEAERFGSWAVQCSILNFMEKMDSMPPSAAA
jgi:hypothetical protein